MVSVNDTLNERSELHGGFTYRQRAEVSQALKEVMSKAPGWAALDATMKEGLEMIAHKIARITAGNPTHADNWHDIAGYAVLVEKEVLGSPVDSQPTPPTPVAPAAPVRVTPQAPIPAAPPVPPVPVVPPSVVVPSAPIKTN
jgi:hypothetical protein